MIDNNKKAVIHIAKMQTGMTENEYRALLSSVGVDSSKELTAATFDIIMQRFKKLGFKNQNQKTLSSKTLLMGKIKAMCASMELNTTYADGIARKMHRIDKYAWCDANQLRKIVAALVYKKNKG